MFTNIENGYNYIGSSISLTNRLKTGYFVPNLQNRVIDLAIKEAGLEQFYLNIYLIPEKLIISETKLKNLTLALEQILILQINPEYNVLKVVGSQAGNKHSPETKAKTKKKYFFCSLLREMKREKIRIWNI
jgi:group I intron endonuclease